MVLPTAPHGPYAVVAMKNVLERLLNLLACLLTADHPVPAEEIRYTVAGYGDKSDEAFHRMFERDKELLREMGIPLELRPTDVWEVEFGYVLPPEDYQLDDPGLSDEERTALWLAAQIVRLGGQPQGPDALLKLGGIPFSGGGEPLAAELGLGSEDLSTAFQAVADRSALEFDYRDGRRHLQPYGLVHQRGHWYVVGGVESRGIRAFRLDRTSAMQITSGPGHFNRPKGFKASDALPGAPWEAGEGDLVAEVHFDAEVAWWAERQLPSTAGREVHSDGSVTARLDVANEDAFVGWVLAFEDKAEILSPPELRARLIQRVKGLR
jgi:predicted DNA-binding transcriptional regulator YafY